MLPEGTEGRRLHLELYDPSPDPRVSRRGGGGRRGEEGRGDPTSLSDLGLIDVLQPYMCGLSSIWSVYINNIRHKKHQQSGYCVRIVLLGSLRFSIKKV